jgi:hypothetical protein
MPKLRGITQRKIIELLDGTYFTSSPFELDFSGAGDVYFSIFFIPNKELKFIARCKSSSFSGASAHYVQGGQVEPDTPFVTYESPGVEMAGVQLFGRQEINECIFFVSDWVQRIYEDYLAVNPVLDEFDRFKQSLNAQFEEHVNDSDAHFSKEEIEEIRANLDALVARTVEFAERMEVTEASLQEALDQIEKLKGDLDTFPKGLWYRVASSKVITTLKNVATSKEGKAFALEAAKKYLLPGA